jgi:soluble lytic murein transglycosylase-like protein
MPIDVPRTRRPRTRRARARTRRPSVRAWVLAGLAVALALLPPTRAMAEAAWTRLDHALAVARAADARERTVAVYAFRYGIPRDLAGAIERAAAEEGIDAELAFRLVRVESAFREDAVSSAGALGLTQLMPATAAELRPGITRAQTLDRDTNLRLGFRYLRWLLGVYGGDTELALTAYNRGPGTVARIRAAGGDADNGYAGLVLGERGGTRAGPARADTAPPAPLHPAHELPPARLAPADR